MSGRFTPVQAWSWQKFFDMLERDEHLVVGLMSGTSADGLDAALVRFNRREELVFSLVDVAYTPYPAELRNRILRAYSRDEGNVELITHLHFELAGFHAESVAKLGWTFDFAAYHGQTVHHLPSVGATLQIGEADVLAVALDRPVVHGFRTKDVALGGQGAPISAYFDAHYFLSEGSTAVLNVGGIANVTVFSIDGGLVAFDTGPGNCLVDLYASWHFGVPYDVDGRYSAQGRVCRDLLDHLLRGQAEYVTKPPPKTTGREVYSASYLRRVESSFPGVPPRDFLRTLVAFTAHTVCENLRVHAPHVDRIVIFGGGAHNATLVEEIRGLGFEVEIPEPTLCDFREAVAIAFLGELFLRGLSVPVVVTGARRASVLGKLAIPA